MKELYKNRRKKLMGQMDGGIAMICSAGMCPDPFLFDKNLEYLTGRKNKEDILVIAPQGITINQFETLTGPEVSRGRIVKEVLFVKERTAREKLIDGEGKSLDDLRNATAIQNILDMSKLDEVLGGALLINDLLWVNVATRPGLNQPLSHDLIQLNTIRDMFLWVRFKNIAPLIHEMRRTKEPFEIDCLRKAFKIHTEAFEKIMRNLKPGENESLGMAVYDYETGSQGPDVTGHGMDRYKASNIIVASGKNTIISHYMDNNQDIQDGDLVLINAGVEYKGYCSDITRTFPANGKFTSRQKELYKIVLEAQKQAIDTMKPGSNARQAHETVYRTWKKYGLEKYGYGFCGHPVGLNIHDANGWRGDDDKPFEPGNVIVIEPMLMIPEEENGIRIEDGVIITEDGVEMMPGPVKEVADIEKLCKRDEQ